MDEACREFSEEMTAYALHELSGSSLESFEEHLKGCAGCRRELEATQRLLDLAAELPRLEVSPRLHGKIMESLWVEKETRSLSPAEKIKLTAGFLAYKLKYSARARFLFIADFSSIVTIGYRDTLR